MWLGLLYIYGSIAIIFLGFYLLLWVFLNSAEAKKENQQKDYSISLKTRILIIIGWALVAGGVVFLSMF